MSKLISKQEEETIPTQEGNTVLMKEEASSVQDGYDSWNASLIVLDWSEDKQSFEQVINETRQASLKEWEEMRKPDEWDMAIDQGKTKKVRKNKEKRRNHKHNPFQEMAEKKWKSK